MRRTRFDAAPCPIARTTDLIFDVPTLIVWGDQDRIIPVQHAHDAHAAIPGSRLEVFEGCGHFVHAEEPARFARVLRQFVATTQPPAEVPTLSGARPA